MYMYIIYLSELLDRASLWVVCSLDFTCLPVVQSLIFGRGETEYKWWSMICFQFILDQMFQSAIPELPFDYVKTSLCAEPLIWKCVPLL